MDHQVIEFIHNHWVLVAMAITLMIIIIAYEFISAQGGGQKVSTAEAIRLINSSDAVILDIRDESVFKQGHVLNALHFQANDVEKQIKKLNKHREKPIIICDQYGQQAAKFVKQLKAQGFTDVRILQGGMQAWQSENLPMVTE
ncbi:MAG: rhodanese-like domain-containing protein [Legionellales bacterium]|nr:rhodanese-like domain-containing protein [Legionellales bacterium]